MIRSDIEVVNQVEVGLIISKVTDDKLEEKLEEIEKVDDYFMPKCAKNKHEGKRFDDRELEGSSRNIGNNIIILLLYIIYFVLLCKIGSDISSLSLFLYFIYLVLLSVILETTYHLRLYFCTLSISYFCLVIL